MESDMKRSQRVILICASIGILHSSMVPPVVQGEDGACRYHAFLERHWPFTLGYDVAHADMVALLSEYGMIVAVAAGVFLALGRSSQG